MNSNEFGVLVAVGPDGIRDGSLDFAASEALRRDTGVELLHVVHSLVIVPAAVEQAASVDRVMSKVGREVLTDVSARMRDRLEGRQPVSTQLLYGPIAATITERASDADVVVLERRAVGALERLLTMSVSSRVASHADVPVVVVPQTWSAAAVAGQPIVVGVDHAPDALGQVEPAAEYARSVGRPLVALHAVWLAEPYQDMVFMDYGRREWVQDATAELDRSLAKLHEQEDLVLSHDLRWAPPTDALVEATRTSSLVVLSRRPAGHLGGAHLGPITRAVLQHAEGPVMLVDRT